MTGKYFRERHLEFFPEKCNSLTLYIHLRTKGEGEIEHERERVREREKKKKEGKKKKTNIISSKYSNRNFGSLPYYLRQDLLLPGTLDFDVDGKIVSSVLNGIGSYLHRVDRRQRQMCIRDRLQEKQVRREMT